MKIFPIAGILLALAPVQNTGAAATQDWPLPSMASAAQPSLSQSPDGNLSLSWIEKTENGHRLQFSRYQKNRWSSPVTISQGSNWFVNWADFPSTTALADGTLWAHNLVKSDNGTYAYDVVLYRSIDGGKHWSAPVTVHDDGTKTEHGFVSLWPWSKSELGIAWLDGRQTAGSAGHEHGAGGKAMSLRAAVINRSGVKRQEWALDTRTCDCCQTDSALTEKGPIVIYRDRDPNEIRDIYTTRFTQNRWQTPTPVADDHWTMPACPVNGPAIAAKGAAVWAAWYTGAGGKASVRLAYSGNSGESFGRNITVKSGPEIQGRTELATDGKNAWLLWTEEQNKQQLILQRFDARLDKKGPPQTLAVLSGRGRATGFARMHYLNGKLYTVWTDIIAGKPVLRGAQVAVSE